MRGVNKVIIVGTLGSDPDVKSLNNGNKVANISVATSEQWNDKQTGERREQTEWHRISLFNSNYVKFADVAEKYLRKGSQVYIEGKLQTRKYQDQSGQDRYITDIRVESMQVLGNKSMAQADNGVYQQQNVYNQTDYQQNSPNPYQSQNPNPMMHQNPQMMYQQPPAQNFPQGVNQFNQHLQANSQYPAQSQTMQNYQQPMDSQLMPQNQPQPMSVPPQQTQPSQMSQSLPQGMMVNTPPKPEPHDGDIPF